MLRWRQTWRLTKPHPIRDKLAAAERSVVISLSQAIREYVSHSAREQEAVNTVEATPQEPSRDNLQSQRRATSSIAQVTPSRPGGTPASHRGGTNDGNQVIDLDDAIDMLLRDDPSLETEPGPPS